MDNLNNYPAEFEFVEETPREYPESPTEFEGVMDDIQDKSEVIIFTDNYCIKGKIALVPGARLTDYIVDASPFIAVADVEVKDKAGTLILTTPFLDVNRDYIELIMPAELATMSGAGS